MSMTALTRCSKRLLPFFENENKPIDQAMARVRIKDKWWFYKPIVNRVLSYTEASSMSPKQLQEFSVAMDLQKEADEAANRNSK